MHPNNWIDRNHFFGLKWIPLPYLSHSINTYHIYIVVSIVFIGIVLYVLLFILKNRIGQGPVILPFPVNGMIEMISVISKIVQIYIYIL